MTKNVSVDGKLGRERPKKRWFEAVECDMITTGVCEAKDRIEWKLRTGMADPKRFSQSGVSSVTWSHRRTDRGDPFPASHF